MNAAEELAAMLTKLAHDAENLQRENDEAIQQIAKLMPGSGTQAVSATFDEQGLLSSLSIDPDARATLEPELLVREINSAILSASLMRTLLPKLPDVAPSDSGIPTSGDGSLLSGLVSVLESGAVAEPQSVSNDLKTVTVFALFGNITEVRCSTQWISSTASELVGDEIVRMSRLAAQQTDASGLYNQGE